MAVFSYLYFVVMVVILFGVTVFVHELGHFLAARRLGLKVETFSIGFGHALWKTRRNGVVYKIGWIPFGGYVALPQMEPGGGRTADADGNEVRLPRVAPWRKILVALAGAAGNVVLAVLIAFVVYWRGKPAALQEISTTVGYVEPGSTAHARGLRAGDEVTAVNGRRMSSWDEVTVAVATGDGDEVKLDVSGPAGPRTIVLYSRDGALGVAGVHGLEGVEGPSYCSVGRVFPGSSAEAAGVRPGDIVVALAGERLFSTRQMVDVVERHREAEVSVVMDRAGERVESSVVPRWDEETGRVLIGIEFDRFYLNRGVRVHPTPGRQIAQHAGLILHTLRALATPRTARKTAGAIGGPPSIFVYLWSTLQAGFIMALWFTALLNVNLAIINLIPLPVLDGGHIVFALVELVARRPLHERVVGALTAVFAVLLISAMLFLSYRDLDRLVGRAFRDRPPPATPAPAAP